MRIIKNIVRFLYYRIVGEMYVPWGRFAQQPPTGEKNLKGKITIVKENNKITWIDISIPEGYSEWRYLYYPYGKYSLKMPASKSRLQDFAYDIEDIDIAEWRKRP